MASSIGTPGPVRERCYYLSLGDSLSTGVQPTGPGELQFRTDEGFSDQLVAVARGLMPGLQLVKLGYPGESTATMLDGGLLEYPHGSQLAEAVDFLKRHRRETAFITIAIGANDFQERSFEGLAAGLESIAHNLPVILHTLQEAAGPEARIAGMTLYDPYLAEWLNGAEGQELAWRSVYMGVVPINAGLTAIYQDAGVEVADVQGAFETCDFEMVRREGIGEVPRSVARILEWTWAGAPPPLGPDPHCNALGYRVIADAFARVVLPRVSFGAAREARIRPGMSVRG